MSEEKLFLEIAKENGNAIFMASSSNLRTHFGNIFKRFNQSNVYFLANSLWLNKYYGLKGTVYLRFIWVQTCIYVYVICHVSYIIMLVIDLLYEI